MKNNNKQPHSLSQIQLEFKPISASFQNNYLNKSFKIYLQRQVQIIGEIKNAFSQSSLKQDFVFPNDQQAVPFRVLKLANSVYQIALYQVNAYNQETFLQVVQLSLSKFVEQYQKQLAKCQEDLWNQLSKDYEKTSIPQIWRALSNNFTKKTFSSALKFNNVAIILEINVTASNKYDKQVKLDDQVQKKRRQERKHTKQKFEFGRSKTAPLIPNFNEAPRNQQPFQIEAPNLNKQTSLQSNLKVNKENNLITSLSIPSLKFHLNKIQEVQEGDHQTDEATTRNRTIKTQEIFLKKQPVHQTEVQQNKQQSQSFKHPEKKPEEQNQQFYAINTAQGLKPDISIKSFNMLKSSQVYENVKSLFMQSGVEHEQEHQQGKKSGRMNILVWFYLLGFGVMIYWLMHPLSKL